MNLKGCFLSNTNEWETPQELFDELNKEFEFTLDPCSTNDNHKCEKFFTKEQDGLSKSWGGNVYSVIHHTAKKFISGLRNVTTRVLKKTL